MIRSPLAEGALGAEGESTDWIIQEVANGW